LAFHIPDDKLAEIRRRADIVDIISERVMLKKTGKEYSGLCPFHAEKTPSFSVNPDKQVFYCFGCGAGGDVFGFIMKSEGMRFEEAVVWLARRYGIELPTRKMTPAQKEMISRKERIFALNRRVMGFYTDCLLKGTDAAAARNYLKKRRISKQIIEGFKLGFAPDSWDRLLRFLARSKVNPDLAVEAGLVVPRKTGNGYYDRFRNRIIFPIIDAGGQVIGFGGRVMDDSKPKYLNSPETPVYHKSKTLYGLDAACRRCREAGSVFIVEGYFDLLALHQHGIENSVATLGTALTNAHVRRIKGYAKKAYLVFDGDAAGIKAAMRCAPVFMAESMSASVILLPRGYDPDSFVFEHGPESFLSLAKDADGIVEFLIEQAIESHGSGISGKMKVVSEIAPVIGAMTDGIARTEYARYLADRIGADPGAVLDKILKNTGPGSVHTSSGLQRPGASINKSGTQDVGTRRIERMIIAMMIQHPASIKDVLSRDVLSKFTDAKLKELAGKIIEFPPTDQGDVSLLMNHLEDESDRQAVASMAMGAMGDTGIKADMRWNERSCKGLIDQFLAGCTKINNDFASRIREAEANNDQELIRQLLSEKQKQLSRRAGH